MLNFEIDCFRSEVLTHSSCLIIGVDDDDSLVSLSDIDQRSLDVLLRLVGLDVDLGVGALQAAIGPVPADLLQSLDDGLVVGHLRGVRQAVLLLHGDGGVASCRIHTGGSRLTWKTHA